MKVLYLLGLGRSGTTLVDLLLGELDGLFSVGELQSLWEEALAKGRRCGCGNPVSLCTFWQRVLLGPHGLAATPSDVAHLQRSELKLHSWRARPAREPRCVGRYVGLLGTLYRSIAEVSGARVIVDSSKLPSVGSLLERVPGIEPFFLHVVRDPRAVAYSWQRPKQGADRMDRSQMERFGSAHSASLWITRQRASSRLRASHPERSLLLRYEDLVKDPVPALEAVASLVGEPQSIGFVRGGRAWLTPNHTVSGNPIRLGSGDVQIAEDRRWETELRRRDIALVTTLTLPFLTRYGYRARWPRPVRASTSPPDAASTPSSATAPRPAQEH